MKKIEIICSIILTILILAAPSCQKIETNNKPTIVVTYSILGSIVNELVGDKADVIVSIPNGSDPHEWEPSAKSIEQINKAALIIKNGLGLEEGMEKCLESAEKQGVKIFTASDHINVRHVGLGEGIPSGDPDQAIGASDPHLWTDPVTMKAIVEALVPVLRQELKIDVSEKAKDLESLLTELDKQISDRVSALPVEDRKLITGHESMGYFAQRYNFKLIGVIVPSITSQAEVSAADLSELKTTILNNHVKAIFAELGTSPSTAKAIGNETGAQVVELITHNLPSDGSYFTFIRNLADTIVTALK